MNFQKILERTLKKVWVSFFLLTQASLWKKVSPCHVKYPSFGKQKYISKFRSECKGTNRKLEKKEKKRGDKVLLCEALKWSRDSHSACESRSILRNVFRSELTLFYLPLSSHVYRLHSSPIPYPTTSISTLLLYIRRFPNGTW
jgi:hypothetical protein